MKDESLPLLLKLFIYLTPTVLLVAYGQIVIKWRMDSHGASWNLQGSLTERLIVYLKDPYILSAYLSSLLGSFAWLFAIARLPLVLAFPIYQGLIFILVVLGSVSILHEPLTAHRLVGLALILAGLVIGARN